MQTNQYPILLAPVNTQDASVETGT